jgi:hypothetical protein
MRTGLEASLRVRSARYVEGPFPAGSDPDAGAPVPDAGNASLPPVVAVVQSANLTIRQGQRAKEFTGSVSFNARTVALGLENDRGYWLVPLDAADVDLPPNLTFRAVADFASDLPVGTRNLLFAGVDANGRVGPRRALPLTVRSSLPDAPLAVVLDWDRAVDLDLTVYLPDGTALSARGLRGADGAWTRTRSDGPRVDLNSNGGCLVDGTDAETATFPAPAQGRYEVRVRMFAACGEPVAHWRVRVLRAGEVVSEAVGASYASEVDAPGSGPAGDGRRALTFSLGG